jgi:hypothetical protein
MTQAAAAQARPPVKAKNGQHFKFVQPKARHFQRNIMYASTMGRPMFKRASERGAVVIAGSGPSLKDLLVLAGIREELDNGAKLCACKKALKFLHDRGFHVDSTVSMDPSPRMAYPDKIFRVPHTTYYIASSSSPALFQYLKDNTVVLWHSACGDELEMSLYQTLFSCSDWVGGGFNVVNRAIGVMAYLGFSRYILAGVDGGYRKGQDFYVDGMEPTVNKIPMFSRTFDELGWYSAPDMIASSVQIAQLARSYDERSRSDDFVILGDTLPGLLRGVDEDVLNRCAQIQKTPPQ